jgi:ribosome-binding protein aMBF1 (putative translation factor)
MLRVKGYRKFGYSKGWRNVLAPTREAFVRSIHTAAHRRLVKRLREAREAAGLTQVEVAAKLRRPQSFVSTLESGERRIDVIELLQLAKLYGVPIGEFVKAVDQTE